MNPLHIITSLLVVAVISLQVFESRAASLPVSGVEGFHRGDSDSPGNGSVSRVIDGSGMTKGDADDPSTWTVSSTAWANDWQGFSANNTWVVFDLGSPAAALDSLPYRSVVNIAPLTSPSFLLPLSSFALPLKG